MIKPIIGTEFQSKRIEDSRDFYERLVTQFPNSGRFWKIYIEHEVVIYHIFSFSSILSPNLLLALFPFESIYYTLKTFNKLIEYLFEMCFKSIEFSLKSGLISTFQIFPSLSRQLSNTAINGFCFELNYFKNKLILKIEPKFK